MEIRALSPVVGAEVTGVDCRQPLTDAVVADLRAAWLEHLVLFFPGQHLDAEQQAAFASRFGELTAGHPVEPPLAEDHRVHPIDSAYGSTDFWHTDVTFNTSPPQFSILNMQVVPSVGGDTMWSNQHLAYEMLSAPMRELLLGLTAVHHAAVFGHPEQQATHPVVREHPETGRPSLFVNRQFTKRIVELSPRESAALLGALYDHSEQPQFNCRYSWTPGTIAIWDNRATQHYVVNDFDERRVLSRVTVLGDDPKPAGDTTRWPAYEFPRFSAAASPFS